MTESKSEPNASLPYSRIEQIMKETEQWLLREKDDSHITSIYSPEVSDALGRYNKNDDVIRTVRSVLTYIRMGGSK